MAIASTSLSPNGARAKPWYRHRWPWLLMSGPAVVVVAGVFTAYLAISRSDALVADDYYKQGKAINKDLSRDREAWRLGAEISMRYDPAARALRGKLQMKQAPAAGEEGRTLFLSLVHPTQPAKDRALVVRSAADGSFSLPLDELEQARWRLVAEDASHAWRLHGAWLWPQQRAVDMSAEAYAPAE
ncbi:FixH family protein [Herbaspirillum sp. LeCh32-8]|uniref:FixH family protein n=1 Tax=Herbaspirillum sp. LeCh32-8 TaxID=2821356 RepID=UPI001AE488C5|nr:FixH family protein [Herbaspirillum sp. LeCh32-8]MBP0596526.1 FixH family protein [Herbaspirillum sp. LeCh32-8]